MHYEAPRRIGFAPMLSHRFLRAQAGRGVPTPLIASEARPHSLQIGQSTDNMQG
jgi:hypothetical protein